MTEEKVNDFIEFCSWIFAMQIFSTVKRNVLFASTFTLL